MLGHQTAIQSPPQARFTASPLHDHDYNISCIYIWNQQNLRAQGGYEPNREEPEFTSENPLSCSIGRWVFTKTRYNSKCPTANDTDSLSLRIFLLKMQTTQHAFWKAQVIILSKIEINIQCVLVDFLFVHPREKNAASQNTWAGQSLCHV